MLNYTYSDLIAWSAELEDWQRDALRRLLTSVNLTDTDIAELADLACPEFSSAEGCMRTAAFATNEHVPTSAHDLPAIRLDGIIDIQRVNALAVGPISFGSDGLTVIYGDNGSGKSGVTRILKKACRARDSGGTILPNIFGVPATDPAAATIKYWLGTEGKTNNWVQGEPTDSNLSAINVFDSKCAAMQIEQANVISYTPPIVRVFPDLASVILSVQAELRDRKASLGKPDSILESFKVGAETQVGKFLAELSKDSDKQQLSCLATISLADLERLKQLDRALGPDPVRLAEVEESRAERIDKLVESMCEAHVKLSDDAMNEFESAVKEHHVDLQAARVAQTEFAQESVLSGLGGDVWHRLWEAARSFSETHAYPSESFPVTRDGGVCVLCQQPLSDQAGRRLHSFEEFVQSDLQLRAVKSRERVAAIIESVELLNLPPWSRAAVAAVGPVSGPISLAIRQVLVGAKLRCRRMRRLASRLNITGLPELPPSPSLDDLLLNIRQEANQLRAASGECERAGMSREREELLARSAIAPHAEAISSEISRLKSVSVIDAAIANCRTNRITLEGGKASKVVITDRLRASFTSNLGDVGFSGTPVEVQIGAGEYGEHPYEMKLTPRPDVPPGQVLSEGERTCVALAGFLAELETTGNTSGIVIDDPVSSLDHQYRKRVAERLVREAKSRQVILLTHDVVFLFLLRKYSHELGVPLAEKTLERGYRQNHGVATEGPPWFFMTVRQRISKLRQELTAARQILNEGDRPRYQSIVERSYEKLRETWERSVEEILLNGTVLRFNDSVQTSRLAKLTDITDGDIETVTREMSRCSDYVHDQAAVIHTDVPDPDIVEGDINRLADWVRELRRHRGRS